MRHRFKAGSSAAASAPEPEGARQAAVGMLARRDFAAGELASRLEQDGYPADAVTAVIAEFTQSRLLDDARFATLYVTSHASRGQGPRRIAMELSARGVDAAQIAASLAAYDDWGVLARSVRSRRFGPTVPESWAEKAKQGRFLQYRGFSSDHVRSALGPDFESEDPS